MHGIFPLAFVALCVLFFLEEFVLIRPQSTIADSDPLSRRIELAAIWIPALGIAITGATMRYGRVVGGGMLNVLGVALALIGLAIRFWARRVLGRFFTIGVVRQEGHTVITSGPYRFVRHPGYLGFLLFYAGLPLTIGNVIGLFALTFPALVIFVLLVAVEDRKMESALGPDYTEYKKHSARLVPGIW